MIKPSAVAILSVMVIGLAHAQQDRMGIEVADQVIRGKGLRVKLEASDPNNNARELLSTVDIQSGDIIVTINQKPVGDDVSLFYRECTGVMKIQAHRPRHSHYLTWNISGERRASDPKLPCHTSERIEAVEWTTFEDSSVKIIAVQPGSPAEKARLMPGDIIWGAQGKTVSSAIELLKMADDVRRQTGAEKPFRMDIERQGVRHFGLVYLVDPPSPQEPTFRVVEATRGEMKDSKTNKDSSKGLIPDWAVQKALEKTLSTATSGAQELSTTTEQQSVRRPTPQEIVDASCPKEWNGSEWKQKKNLTPAQLIACLTELDAPTPSEITEAANAPCPRVWNGSDWKLKDNLSPRQIDFCLVEIRLRGSSGRGEKPPSVCPQNWESLQTPAQIRKCVSAVLAEQKGLPVTIYERISERQWALTATTRFLFPGHFLLSHIWIDLSRWRGFAASLLISWWTWLTALRLIWCVPARRLGLYNPERFRLWTYLWPWRPLYRALLPLFAWIREFAHGKRATAKWTPTLETMTLLYKPGLIPLGRLRWRGLPLFQPIGIEGSGRHLAMIAAPGSGKTTMLMTMLGLHRGTCFVVDCDAQMINAVGKRLGAGAPGIFGKGNDVRLLDPYHQAKNYPGSSWNAIWEMHRFVKEHGKDAAVGFAQTMAEALIKGSEGQNAWVQKDARAFLKGLILYVGFHERPENRNLVRLRRLLANGLSDSDDEDPFEALLERMQGIDDFGGAISNAAGVMSSSHGSDGKNHPRADALEQTQWLDLPQLAAICNGSGPECCSDFDLHDLKKGKLCLFICAPVTDVQTKLSGYFRLLTMLTMEAFQRLETVSLKNPCLFAIDEMPALGHIEVLQTAAPVFRKYGVRLLCIAQDIERLKAVYPRSWGGFLGTAEAVVWMGLEHDETLETLAKKLSESTRDEKADGGGFFSKAPARSQKVERPLLYPQQIKELLDPQRGNIIVTRFGKRPLRLKNIPYYTELPVYFYETDRKFSERPGRKLGRRICALLAPGKTPGVAQVPAASSPVKERPTHEAPQPEQRAYSASAATEEAPPQPETFAGDPNVGAPRRESRAKNRKDAPKLKAADINFLRAFTECFDEKDGAYPHPRIRRRVWEGFAPYIMQGGEFQTLKLQLEDWLAAEIEERPRAEHVMIFFEDWIEHSRQRDIDAAEEA